MQETIGYHIRNRWFLVIIGWWKSIENDNFFIFDSLFQNNVVYLQTRRYQRYIDKSKHKQRKECDITEEFSQ